MEVLLMAVLMAVLAASNILCFAIGAKVGQRVAKDEPVELPTINPMQAYREKEARKEAQRKQDELDTILQNVDNYDGTPNGQVDVR